MARKRERTFAAFGAALFLVVSSMTTIAVVIVLVQQHKSQAVQGASTTKGAKVENKLEGTQLSGFTPVSSISELKRDDLKPGNGGTVKAGDTITVDYTGAVASTGKIFQSSLDSGQPVSFPLSQVVAGWSQGIPGMKVGGTSRLLIPASLAYGANPPAGSGIPANADLVFDVTVHKIGS